MGTKIPSSADRGAGRRGEAAQTASKHELALDVVSDLIFLVVAWGLVDLVVAPRLEEE